MSSASTRAKRQVGATPATIKNTEIKKKKNTKSQTQKQQQQEQQLSTIPDPVEQGIPTHLQPHAAAYPGGNEIRSLARRLNMAFSPGREYRGLNARFPCLRIGPRISIYIGRILDIIMTQMIMSACDLAKTLGDTRLQPTHLRQVIENDDVLHMLVGARFYIKRGGVQPYISPELLMSSISDPKSQAHDPTTTTTATAATTEATTMPDVDQGEQQNIEQLQVISQNEISEAQTQDYTNEHSSNSKKQAVKTKHLKPKPAIAKQKKSTSN